MNTDLYGLFCIIYMIEISFNDIWRVHIYFSLSIAQDILVLGLGYCGDLELPISDMLIIQVILPPSSL